jgi:hypothetical protein
MNQKPTYEFSLAKLSGGNTHVYYRWTQDRQSIEYVTAAIGHTLCDEFCGYSYATPKKFFKHYDIVEGLNKPI